jgi:hypothetical protein
MNAIGFAAVMRDGMVAGMCLLAGAASAESRGEMLYTTHCIACHTTQMHWREKRVATDWDTLREQVRLWQGRAQLSWSEADIVEVTRYLNKSIYRFGEATQQTSLDRPDGIQKDGSAGSAGTAR